MATKLNPNQNKRHMMFESNLKVRSEAESDEKFIEGYFAVFDQETELWPGAFEEIAPGAFDNSLKDNDIRCLFNHDTSIVMGRMVSKTLELRTDSKGLWGKVSINPNDKEASDIYARVERGDISGCSFGFMPIEEQVEHKEDGTVKWRVLEADTFEVSVCSFPAYPQTSVQARKADFEQHVGRRLEQRRQKAKERLTKCLNN